MTLTLPANIVACYLARAALALFVAVLMSCEAASPIYAVPSEHPCPDKAVPVSTAALWSELAEAQTLAPITLLIPLEPGLLARVSQANRQAPTHQERLAYAWDFAVDEGTLVTAAAPGIVVWVRQDSDAYGTGVESVDDANWIVVDHGGGLFTSYVHLEAMSALVAAGDLVSAGQPLALTGLSGMMSGPHLHFQVENVWSQSVPAGFVSTTLAKRCDWVPITGEDAGQSAELAPYLLGPEEASELPHDAFKRFGVDALYGAKARLISRSDPITLYGQAQEGAERVWALLLPEGGGDALAWLEMPVVDGHFEGVWDLGHVPTGRYGWAVVAMAEGVAPSVEESIRVSLLE